MAGVRRSPQAHLDLVQLWLYVGECRLLAGMPRMGRARPELRPDVRSFPVGPFMIFYREIEGGIEIVRVARGARDLSALFKQG